MPLGYRPLIARLRRLHWASWGAIALATIAMVLITVPSYPAESRHKGPGIWWEPRDGPVSWWDHICARVYHASQDDLAMCGQPNADATILMEVHGWPQPCLARSQRISSIQDTYVIGNPRVIVFGQRESGGFGDLRHYVQWSHYYNWPFEAGHWGVHPLNLLLDLAVFAAIIGGVGASVEWWVRSRGGLFRFRLLDVLAAFTVCAVGLAWHQYHARLHASEAQIETDLTHDDIFYYFGYRNYTGPDWLQRLAGHSEYVPFLHHVTYVEYYVTDDWQDDLGRISRLPYVEGITLTGAFPKEAVAQLANFRRLKTLAYQMPSSDNPLANWIDVAPNPHSIGPNDLGVLAPLSIEEFVVSGDEIIVDDLEQLLSSSPRFRVLVIKDASITKDEYEDLCRRFPTIDIREEIFEILRTPSQNAYRVPPR